ncbi:MAG: TraR/DksA family transcriptional regulator [Microgenomates group bacterium]
MLEKQKEEILKRINTLKQDDPFSDPEHVSDNAAVDTDVREQVGHDNIEAQINDLEKKLQLIDEALKNIKKDKYGICNHCGKAISTARLKIIPEALYCVDCEQKMRR